MISTVSFLNDAASEMIVPLLPLFLTTVLGGTAVSVAVIEGAADAVAAVLKLGAGRLGDRSGRQKPFIVGGYALAGLSRTLIALATSAGMVAGLRVIDRVGKGLRSAPRDALLAASADPADRARVFSFHRALDNGGALVGAGVAWWLLSQEGLALRSVFFASALPALLAVALVAFAVKDRPAIPAAGPIWPGLPTPALRRVLWPLALFTAGHVGDTLLLLRASELGAAPATLPLLWMGLHLVKSVAGLGAGAVAERLGRLPLVVFGWTWCAATYAVLGLTDTLAVYVPLFVAYGLYHGLVEGTERALVADLAPVGARGTAFGWYHLTSGVGALPASLLLGGLWAGAGATVALGVAAVLTAAAAGALMYHGRDVAPVDLGSGR